MDQNVKKDKFQSLCAKHCTHNLVQESVRPELGGRVSSLSEDTVEDPVGHGAGGETNYSLEWPAKWRQLSRRGSCKGNKPKTDRWTRETKFRNVTKDMGYGARIHFFEI